jgi:hypothetical protein
MGLAPSKSRARAFARVAAALHAVKAAALQAAGGRAVSARACKCSLVPLWNTFASIFAWLGIAFIFSVYLFYTFDKPVGKLGDLNSATDMSDGTTDGACIACASAVHSSRELFSAVVW